MENKHSIRDDRSRDCEFFVQNNFDDMALVGLDAMQRANSTLEDCVSGTAVSLVFILLLLISSLFFFLFLSNLNGKFLCSFVTVQILFYVSWNRHKQTAIDFQVLAFAFIHRKLHLSSEKQCIFLPFFFFFSPISWFYDNCKLLSIGPFNFSHIVTEAVFIYLWFSLQWICFFPSK